MELAETKFFVLRLAVIVLFLSIGIAHSREIKDTSFYFSITIPDMWDVRVIDDPSSQFRVEAKSKDSKQYVEIYSVKATDTVDIEKLSDLDRNIIKISGKLIKTQSYPGGIFIRYIAPELVEKIIKTYETESHRLIKILFKAEGPYGFVVVWYGPISDESVFYEIINTFVSEVPLKERAIPEIKYVVGVFLAFVLGLLGLAFRMNREKRKKLKATKSCNTIPIGRWNRENRKALLKLCLIPLCCVVIYLTGIKILDGSGVEYIFIFAGPILPIFGYWGILAPEPDVN